MLRLVGHGNAQSVTAWQLSAVTLATIAIAKIMAILF